MTKKKIMKSGEEDACSPLSSLPDEMILLILNKLIDLKALCSCYLVSRRFSSIVLQVDAISFTAPLINPPIPDKNTAGDVPATTPVSPPLSSFYCEYFRIATGFLSKFKGVKSLCIEFSSSREIGSDSRCLSKWMVKFGHRVESFVFLSPNSIFDMDGVCLIGNWEEDDHEVIGRTFKQKFDISFQYLCEAMVWHLMLLELAKNHPMLEIVSVTDTGRRGRLSLSGEKLSEVKEWVHSVSETELARRVIPDIVRNDYIPVLKLPVTGCVMKGVYVGIMEMKDVQGGYDDLMKREDGFGDREGAVYNEAVMKILENHKGAMDTVVNGFFRMNQVLIQVEVTSNKWI